MNERNRPKRTEVEKIAFHAGDYFKKSAYSMIERSAPIFAAENDRHEVKRLMRKEFDRMLRQVSDHFRRMAEGDWVNP